MQRLSQRRFDVEILEVKQKGFECRKDLQYIRKQQQVTRRTAITASSVSIAAPEAEYGIVFIFVDKPFERYTLTRLVRYTKGRSRVSKRHVFFTILTAAWLLSTLNAIPAEQSKTRQQAGEIKVALWRNPTDIVSRDLIYGSGGPANAPIGPYVFIKEDLSGTNPKLDLRDGQGRKWQVKFGAEARPETAASRVLWAAGYQTAYYYFIPEIRIENMPSHLTRGQNLIAPDGTIHDVRLRRHPWDKKGSWRWKCNPFMGAREYNGLRVVMALINNWDLKDNNNSIYVEKDSEDSESLVDVYAVTDLGASFGKNGLAWPASRSKGNLESYGRSEFIHKITRTSVSFDTPARPALLDLFDLPDFIRRLGLRWIGRRIPRADAKWIGELLAMLSEAQIRDAFRAAGYSPAEVEGFTKIVRGRISELNRL